jgi:probable phosphoglycerate mutase
LLIYAIRHGQTDWNAEGRLQGSRDVPLNDVGRAQARGNGRLLKKLLGKDAEMFDFVSSPLGRARETMRLILAEMAREPDSYRTDTRLIEVAFGDWEAQTLEEIDTASPGAVATRDADKWHFLPPGEGAESYEMLSGRVASWLDTVDGPTVCVAHGGIIRSFMRLLGGASPNEAAMAAIHQDRILRIDGRGVEWI